MYRNQPMSVNASILYKNQEICTENQPMSVNASIHYKNQEIYVQKPTNVCKCIHTL